MSYTGMNEAMNSLSFNLRNLIEAVDKCKQDPILMAQIHERLCDEESNYHFCDMVYKLNRKRSAHFWDKKLTDYVVDNDSLDLFSMGWNHSGGYYRFKNRCMEDGSAYVCKELKNHCDLILDDKDEVTDNKKNPISAMDDLSKIFLDEKCGWVFSYLFAYGITSLFASLLLKINPARNIPFYLQIAVGNNSAADTLIKEIWRICDVTVGIEIIDCACDNKEKYHCTDVPQVYSPAVDLSHDILLLKHKSDVPVIINARMKDDKSYYASLIQQFSGADFRKVTTMPIFVTDELVTGYENFINIDLTAVVIEEEYLALIAANKGLLSSLVYTFIKNCSRNENNEIKYRKNPYYGDLDIRYREGKDYHGDEYHNLPGLLSRYALDMKMQFYEGIKDGDIICIFYLKTFFEYFITSFNDRVVGSGGSKESFKEKITDFKGKVSASIFNTHKTYSPSGIQDVLLPQDMDCKKERETKQLIAKLEDECNALKIYFAKNNIEIKDDKTIIEITLQKGTKKEALHINANDIGHRLKKRVKISERGNDIKIVLSDQRTSIVSLLDLFERVTKKDIEGMAVPFILGEDEFGEPFVTDLADIPHLLIGGTTNSGKSVALKALVSNIIHYSNSEDTKLILIDLFTGRLSHTFDSFAGSDYLGYNLVTDVSEALYVLSELDKKIKNWDGTNDCRIICVIDEFDVLFQYGKTAEKLLNNLLSRARKVNIHLVLATQGATKSKIKIEKDNLSAKMAFQCSNVYQSLAIIGNGDARFLYGKGDMLFCSQHSEFYRIQGAYLDNVSVNDIVEPTKHGLMQYVISPPTDDVIEVVDIYDEAAKEEENLFEAICLAFKENKCSISRLKAHFNVGFTKADVMLSKLVDMGIVKKPMQGKHPEPILPKTYDNLSDEVKILLEKHNMTKDEVNMLLEKTDSQ